MKVSHGCVRLYPEDIERLFPLVPIGTPGEFIYRPVKIGTRGGIVYAEMHRDIYADALALDQEAKSMLERLGLAERVDEQLLKAALEDPSGIPIPVSPEPSAPAEVSPASTGEPNGAVEGDVDPAPHPEEGPTTDFTPGR